MRILLLWILLLIKANLIAQNKSGYTWIVGSNASYAAFDGTLNAPVIGQKFNGFHPNFPYIYYTAHSNICESNGNILFSTSGMTLFDSLGNIIENGDSLQPNNAYAHNCCPANLSITQGSMILPKGDSQEYFIFIPTVSDSIYNIFWTNPVAIKAPFDLLHYDVVDMKLNFGNGKVVEKNKVLLKNVELSKVMMQACKHANGVDWWLLKHALNDNTIYRFLITKDSIYGPFVQYFTAPQWGWFDLFGQCAFSKDGMKYGAVMGNSNKLFLADFDRCSGELSNPKIFNVPIDSTTDPYWDDQGIRDSSCNGISFSSNNQFVYISKRWNIYQYEINQPDSSLAWYRVKHGFDTTKMAFEGYRHLYRAPNNRIYIGKIGGSLTQFSVIDNPDNKGPACNFCRKCFRIDTAAGGLTSPPNMPDYELGPDTTKPCWPLSIQNSNTPLKDILLSPNPVSTTLRIESASLKQHGNDIVLLDLTGRVWYKAMINSSSGILELDIHTLPPGIYLLKVNGVVKKILKE